MSTNTFDCPDKASLVTLLYGEGSGEEERRRLEGHVLACEACAAELGGLRSVRGALAQWTAPELPLGFRVVGDQRPAPSRRWWVAAPLAAAAGLVLAAAAALANVEVRVGADGLIVRTGWGTASEASARTGGASEKATAAATPWHADLASLEKELRREFAATPVSARAARATEEKDLFRRLQVLIDRSETRQQEQLAQQISDLAMQFQVERREDLVRISHDLGRLELQRGVDQRALNQFVRLVSAQQSVP